MSVLAVAESRSADGPGSTAEDCPEQDGTGTCDSAHSLNSVSFRARTRDSKQLGRASFANGEGSRVSLSSHCVTALAMRTLSAIPGAGEEALDGARSSVLRLLSLVKRDACLTLLATILLVVHSAADAMLPILVSRVIDVFIDADKQLTSEVFEELMLLVKLRFFTSLAGAAKDVFPAIAGERLVARLRRQLFEALLRQEVAFFESERSGDLGACIVTDTRIVQEAAAFCVSSTFAALLRTLVCGVASVLTSWKLACAAYAILPVIGCILWRAMTPLTRLNLRCQEALGRASGIAEECFGNIKVVRSFGAERLEAIRYGTAVGYQQGGRQRVGGGGGGCLRLPLWPAADGSVYNHYVVRQVVTATGFTAVLWLFSVSMYGAYWMGFGMVGRGELSVGELMAIVMLLMNSVAGLGIIGLNGSKMSEAMGAFSRITYITDREPLILAEGGLRPPCLRGDVAFEDVSFAYPSRPDAPILEGLSFRVVADSMVAFVGPSGAGKSTVLSLLDRFYEVSEGRVLVDGHDVRNLDPSWLRQHIAFVQQEPVLFAMSIRANLAYGRTAVAAAARRREGTAGSCDLDAEISFEELDQQCERANARGFIVALPEGYDTVLGERGTSLSGGQRQRLVIARALLAEPRILLLDEATSALDSESEHLVQQALSQATSGRTVLAVAHRLSTIKDADQIFMMDAGSILDSGRHDELMERCEKYRECVRRQQGNGQHTVPTEEAMLPTNEANQAAEAAAPPPPATGSVDLPALLMSRDRSNILRESNGKMPEALLVATYGKPVAAHEELRTEREGLHITI